MTDQPTQPVAEAPRRCVLCDSLLSVSGRPLAARSQPIADTTAPRALGEQVVEPCHNHTTAGLPTYPVFREACPLGCDTIRAGEIAANTGIRPNLFVVDPFAEAAAMRAIDRAIGAAGEVPSAADYPAEGPVPTSVQNAWNEAER